MANYILQVILYQVLFLAVYDFFLSKETFFTKNRWYLLVTPILSFIIPFIKIPTFQKSVPQDFIIHLPEVFLSPEKVITDTFKTQDLDTSLNYIQILFCVGVFFFTILFLVKLMKIINLIRSNEIVEKAEFKLILLPKQSKAFSFFNYIFLGKEIKANQKEKVIQHELVHAKQKHSYDLLFFEFLKIGMWFNPMIYIYQQRITLIHEYISDAIAAKNYTKESYINNLLSNLFQVENITFINQFQKQSFIKKRITMITKKQSQKMNQLKYLIMIPLLMSMLFYSSCSENSPSELTSSKKELSTIYSQIGNNTKLEKSKGTKETYLDFYMGTEIPKWEEITYNDLTNEERNEFDNKLTEFNNSLSNQNNFFQKKLFKGENGRNIIGVILNSDRLTKEIETEETSFNTIDKAPTFPGCEEGDKKCFSLMVQKHFVNNFDTSLLNSLDLKAGKKRIFVSFKIDKKGNIIDVKARAPHEKLKEEVLSVMQTLPKIIPGEHEGETVNVKYSIPITIKVE